MDRQEKLRWALGQLEGAFNADMVYQHEWQELADDAEAEGIDLSEVQSEVEAALTEACQAGAVALRRRLDGAEDIVH
jgi:hypothetical protein